MSRVRNGRYVIPVRDDARRAVRGIIHDRSQSGATVFVEPEETIPLNNELTRLCLEERDEEQRVLGELTGRVRDVLPASTELVEGLGALDLIFAARGPRRAARRLRARGGRRRDLDLRAARHPLLVAQRWGTAPGRATSSRSTSVLAPIGPASSSAGPNAGGKTVALETPGPPGPHGPGRLPRPRRRQEAACRSRSRSLAIVGDDQSVAENLSTFSVVRPPAPRDARPSTSAARSSCSTSSARARTPTTAPRSAQAAARGARSARRARRVRRTSSPSRSSPQLSPAPATPRSRSTASGSSRRSAWSTAGPDRATRSPIGAAARPARRAHRARPRPRRRSRPAARGADRAPRRARRATPRRAPPAARREAEAASAPRARPGRGRGGARGGAGAAGARPSAEAQALLAEIRRASTSVGARPPEDPTTPAGEPRGAGRVPPARAPPRRRSSRFRGRATRPPRRASVQLRRPRARGRGAWARPAAASPCSRAAVTVRVRAGA